MKQKLLIATYLLALCLAACFRELPAVAINTTFTQSIRPIVCTVSTIGVGQSQIVQYSKACGPVIAPPSRPTYTQMPRFFQSQNNHTTLPPVSSSPSNKAIVYLHNNPDLYQPGGVTLLLHKDTVYSFRMPGDNTLFPARTLEVLQMTVDSVVIQFSSPQSSITLRTGQIAKMDIMGRGKPDTMLLLEGFHSPDTAFTRFALLTMPDGVSRQNHSTIMIVLGATLMLLLTTHLFHRRKLPPSGRIWRTPSSYHKL